MIFLTIDRVNAAYLAKILSWYLSITDARLSLTLFDSLSVFRCWIFTCCQSDKNNFVPRRNHLSVLLITALTNHSAVGGTSAAHSAKERPAYLSVKHPIKLNGVNRNNTGKEYKIKPLHEVNVCTEVSDCSLVFLHDPCGGSAVMIFSFTPARLFFCLSFRLYLITIPFFF